MVVGTVVKEVMSRCEHLEKGEEVIMKNLSTCGRFVVMSVKTGYLHHVPQDVVSFRKGIVLEFPSSMRYMD